MMAWILTMVAICSMVWGGFAWLLLRAARAERHGRHAE
jgi:hypothetical protein